MMTKSLVLKRGSSDCSKAATTTIPIVFAIPEDPVSLGLVASLSRSGANLTGVNFFFGELVPKRLEILRESSRIDPGRRLRQSGQSFACGVPREGGGIRRTLDGSANPSLQHRHCPRDQHGI